MKKRIKILFFALILVISVFTIGDFVLAQTGDLAGLQYGEQTGLTDTDPRIVVARVIQIALGFLGIIAVGLIIYGGWMYMTSEGNEEKIEKAKKILKSAVIGLIIILSAFGIASFILSRLLGASGIGGDGCTDGDSRDCGCGGTQVCSGEDWGSCLGSSCGSQGDVGFYVRSTTPNDGDVNVIRNIKISAFLNKSLNSNITPTELEENVKVEKIGSVASTTGDVTPIDSVEIAGEMSTELDNSAIFFKTNSECEVLVENVPTTIENCLDEWSQYRVTINSNTGLFDMNNIALNSDEDNPSGKIYEFIFNTNNDVDLGPPTAGVIPTQICQDDGTIKIDSNILGGWGRDDKGLNWLSFLQKASSSDSYDLEYFEPAGSSEYYSTKYKASTTYLTVGEYYNFMVEAEDIADQHGNEVFTTKVRPGHCCNGVQDDNEDGVDCGGDCLACLGGPCNREDVNKCSDADNPYNESNCDDSKCSTFFCECQSIADGYTKDGCFCAEKPVIDWVSPKGGYCNDHSSEPCNQDTDCTSGTCNSGTPNANLGNIISIGGRNFGTATGKVFFGDVEASFPNTVNPDCNKNWTDTEITVLVPNTAVTGPIKVIAANNYEDTTDNAYGAPIPDFEITGFDRPGLCLLTPNSGELDDRINYSGLGLLGSSAFFGDKSYNLQGLNEDFTDATGESGSTLVPNIENGKTSSFTKIKIGGVDVESNYKDFTKTISKRGPQIRSFDPKEGSEGQYVTIRGEGFGPSKGISEVYFGSVLASYDFPEVCSDSLWSDNQIIVKVPGGINDGNYKIRIDLGSLDYDIDTTLLMPPTFNISASLPLAPGACKVDPYYGLTGDDVSIWGEYFGNFSDTLSKVRFAPEVDQTGGSIGFWGQEDTTLVPKPDKATTSVPLGVAEKGFVKIVIDDLAGNALDFTAGKCYDLPNPNEACGETRVCCGEDSFRPGECQSDIRDCYFEVRNSVYEYEFKTGVNCPSNSEACGTNCCSTLNGGEGCETSAESKCAGCDAGQDRCSDNSCCDVKCEVTDSETGASICPTTPLSCSGYAYDQCLDTLFCPNSPGRCSPYESDSVKDGDCEYNGSNISGCENGDCDFISIHDRFASSTQSCDLSLDGIEDINGNSVSPTCKYDSISQEYRWIFDSSASCIDGWTKGNGEYCVKSGTTGTCSVCSTDFDCVDVNGTNKCLSKREACPGEAVCNSNGDCMKDKPSTCECCCEKGQDARDCCPGLTCAGTCGAGSADLDNDSTTPDSEFGSCSGCVELDANGNVDQDASDLACNCSSSSGKYCDTSVDVNKDGIITGVDGVCSDCAQIPASKCKDHSATCCVDAGLNICGGGSGQEITTDKTDTINYGYCAYYTCDSTTNTCGSAQKTGSYDSLTKCDEACGGTQPGKPCYNKIDNTCSLECVNPYNCMSNEDSCLCCCDPSVPDICQSDGLEGLNCQANKGPCSGDNRGLCCGCFEDSECVASGDALEVGCSSDSCCRPRPKVDVTDSNNMPYPANGSDNVCRNAEIGAWFDTLMDKTSFTGNMLVLGDYGNKQCPDGTQYLVLDNNYKEPNIFARTYLKIERVVLKTVAFLLHPVIGNRAYAIGESGHTYCVVPGAISGVNSANSEKTKIVFKPSILLDAKTKYYAVIKGDENYDSSQGVRSSYRVAMAEDSTGEFNGIEYNNAYIWEFTTLPDQGGDNGVCQVDKVEIYPESYLFQTTENDLNENDLDPEDLDSFDKANDRDKLFTANAVGGADQVLVPISGYYSWTWDWAMGDYSIATFTEVILGNDNRRLIQAQDGVVDAHTKTNAIMTATGTLLTVKPQIKSGKADIYVFICDNPWPAITDSGWSPWRDSDSNCPGGDVCHNTNYELYYCRDAGGEGTYDDLPVINEGVNLPQSDKSLKETYFFRSYSVVKPEISGSVYDEGKKVKLNWSSIPRAEKYKIYYSSANGNGEIEVVAPFEYDYFSGKIKKDVPNLENGIVYSFRVTAFSSAGNESEPSNSIELTPWDKEGPQNAITDFQANPGENEGEVKLSWIDSSGGDVDRFAVRYKCGIEPTQCNAVFSAGGQFIDTDTKTSYTFSGLPDIGKCCFGIRAYDQYGNESDIVATSLVVPAEPI